MSDHIKGPGGISGQPPRWGVGAGAATREPGLNEKILFWASFFTLIAAGMGFSIRGDILADWGKQFGFTQTELGTITGQGLAGFGLTIIFFSFFSDIVGYGKLMVIAFLLHAISIAVTLAAPYAFAQYGKDGAFWCLYIGAWSFSLGNGTCEAVINPLTATLFPKNKTHWLNILHAGWPGGLVLGALVGYGLNKLQDMGLPAVGWMGRWGIVLAPMLLYGVMMLGRPFPESEAKESGVPLGMMILTILSPILLFLFLLHAMIGYVELGTDSWIQNITKTVLADKNTALLAFMWTNILMFTLRFFAGPIVHKISPVGLLFFSAIIGTVGLWMLGQPFTNTTWMWLAAVTVYGIGKTFYWPTMLGVISERYPQGGALALGLSGGIGMISAGFLGGPIIGYEQDVFASRYLKEQSPAAYTRYMGDEHSPLSFVPTEYLPKVAGLDNAKVGVLQDDGKGLAAELALKPDDTNLLKLEAWWLGAKKSAAEGKKPVELDNAKLGVLQDDGKGLAAELALKPDDPNLVKLETWWLGAKKSAAKDEKPVEAATLEGGKKALEWTAVVPAAMAVGYLLLIFYFMARGGYKQETLPGSGGH